MLDWQAIDSVFLDMDGTLLDLHFDNHFWLDHLPMRLAEQRCIPLPEASAIVMEIAGSHQGKLEWYCTDFWSRQLALDIPALKHETAHLIRFRPGVEHFLVSLAGTGKRRILVTNAHPDVLRLKLARTGLQQWFDRLISSHELGHAKESASFWDKLGHLEPFSAERTLMIDDSLPVLRAARAAGIRWLLGIEQPDSRRAPVRTTEFPLVADFSAIHPVLAA